MRTFYFKQVFFFGTLAFSVFGAAAGCGDEVSSTTNGTGGSNTGGSNTGGMAGGGTGGTGGMATGGAGGGSGGSGGGMAFADIKGTFISKQYTEAGVVDNPRGPNSYKVSAMVLQADKTFSAPIDGTNKDDGTFLIPAVPAGLYYLVHEPVPNPNNIKNVIVTDVRDIALGSAAPGRQGAQRAMMSPTTLSFDLMNLNTWQDNDILEFFALGSRTYGATDMLMSYTNPPAAGATSLAGTGLDVTKFMFTGLVDGSKGDKAYLGQLVTHSMGALNYRALEKIYEPASFTQQDGMPASFSGSFVNVPLKSRQVTWERDAFLKLAPEVHPDASLNNAYVVIFAAPGGLTQPTSQIPRLAEIRSMDNAATVQVALNYGNPYPGGWTEVATADTIVQQFFTVPNDPQMHRQTTALSNSVMVNANGQVTLAPEISPPQNLMVNGMPGTMVLSGVGTSPKIEWQAPKMGTPSLYRIQVHVVDPAQTGTRNIGQVITKETSFVFPPGILTSGNYYTVRVSAVIGPVDSMPFQTHSGPTAGALSGAFTP